MPGKQGNIYFFSLIIDLQFLRILEITVLLDVSVKSEEKLALSVPASYAVIADEDLYHIVLAIVNDFPNCGYKRLTGFLLARGLSVQERADPRVNASC